MYHIGGDYPHKYKADSQHVKCKSTFLERMEETRPHLKTDGKHEQDKSELLEKMEQIVIRTEAEMAQEDTHEQNPCRTERDSLEFESSQINSGCNDKGEQHNRMPCTLTEKQISHIFYLCLGFSFPSQKDSSTQNAERPSVSPSI